MKRRRGAIAFVLSAVACLLTAQGAFALAGGGYSGGGGNGHLGGGWIALLVIMLLVWLVITVIRVYARATGKTTKPISTPLFRKRVAARERQVELASAEAADDDSAFASERVHADAAKLFRDIQTAWSNDDRAKLRTLVGPDLMKEWTRRLDNFKLKGGRTGSRSSRVLRLSTSVCTTSRMTATTESSSWSRRSFATT